MNCCRQCFEDSFLKGYIEEHGEEGDCEYCGAEDEFVIEAADLCDLFQRFLDLYGLSNDGTGESLATLIEDEWGTFKDQLVVRGEHHDLLQDILRGHASEEDLLDVPDVRDLWREDLPDERLVDKWDEFAESLREGGLEEPGDSGVLVPPDAEPEAQLNDPFVWVSEDLGHVTKAIPAGTPVFRCRLRYLKDGANFVSLPIDQMGAPPPEKAKAGRANPEGTRVLYCAEEEATAIAEVRPARGQLISVAGGATTEELNILDFAENVYFETPFTCEYLPSLVQSYELFNRWGDDLAKPLRHSDDVQDYYPTQFQAQWIRTHHYDGIRYPSALAANGHNLVIFDPCKVQFTRCRLAEIRSMSIQYGDLELE